MMQMISQLTALRSICIPVLLAGRQHGLGRHIGMCPGSSRSKLSQLEVDHVLEIVQSEGLVRHLSSHAGLASASVFCIGFVHADAEAFLLHDYNEPLGSQC